MEPSETPQDPALVELKRQNELLTELVVMQKDLKAGFIQGLVRGFGGVVGATLVVSLLVAILQPLRKFEALEPVLNRIAEALEQKPSR